MKRPELSGLQALVAVATRQSFRAAAAAAELGLPASAVSHAISSLEERMGMRLFQRTTRGVAFYEAGRDSSTASRLLQVIEAAIDVASIFNPRPTGTQRIKTSEAAGHKLLALYLPEYPQRYPDMQVDSVAEGGLVDIVAETFDAGMRLSGSVPKDVVAARFGQQQGFVVADAPTYVVGRAVPITPHDLQAHRSICNRPPSGALWRWEFSRQAEIVSRDVEGTVTRR